MIIRCYWKNCNYRNGNWGTIPIDSFWVEATQEEAEVKIFPKLQPEIVTSSKEIAESSQELSEQVGNPPRPYCFLVSKDFSSIDPFPVNYPFNQMWNAYSPFKWIHEINIQSLEEIRDLNLPISNKKTIGSPKNREEV